MNGVVRAVFHGYRNWLFRLVLFVCLFLILLNGSEASGIKDYRDKQKARDISQSHEGNGRAERGSGQGANQNLNILEPPPNPSLSQQTPSPPRAASSTPPSGLQAPPPTSVPKSRSNTSGNDWVFPIVAFGVLLCLVVSGLVVLRRFQKAKCPRCGGVLHSGSCDLCGYPRVPCSVCGMAPVDGVCPECDKHLGLRVRYNEGYLIGKGGFGEVYQAIWSETGTEWASWHGQAVVKKFMVEGNSSPRDPETLARWKQLRYEADVLTYLQTGDTPYPYAPRCRNRDGLASIRYEATEVSGDEFYFVMDRAFGESIAKFWNKDERRMAQIPGRWSFLLHLAKALNGLRALNVAHRDIKPDNLYWDEKNNRLTVIDFGSARCENPQAINGETVRNPVEAVGAVSKQWAAPEHVRYGLSAAGCAADLYSYGLLFCAVLLGFYCGSPREVPREELEHRAGPKLTEFILSQALEPNAQIRGAKLMEKYRALILALQVRCREEKAANA